MSKISLPTDPLLAKLDLLRLTRITSMMHLEELEEAARQGPAKAFLTIPEVAKLVNHTVRDVYSWIKWGKSSKDGRRLLLHTTEFWPGAHIVPWEALLAYGLGVPFEEYEHAQQPQVIEVEFGPKRSSETSLRRRRKSKGGDSTQILRVSK